MAKRFEKYSVIINHINVEDLMVNFVNTARLEVMSSAMRRGFKIRPMHGSTLLRQYKTVIYKPKRIGEI
jgi:hypothetical protein